MTETRLATALKKDCVDAAMLRRSLESWLADMQSKPPEEGEECTFAVTAYAREHARGTGFTVEIVRTTWRNT